MPPGGCGIDGVAVGCGVGVALLGCCVGAGSDDDTGVGVAGDTVAGAGVSGITVGGKYVTVGIAVGCRAIGWGVAAPQPLITKIPMQRLSVRAKSVRWRNIDDTSIYMFGRTLISYLALFVPSLGHAKTEIV